MNAEVINMDQGALCLVSVQIKHIVTLTMEAVSVLSSGWGPHVLKEDPQNPLLTRTTLHKHKELQSIFHILSFMKLMLDCIICAHLKISNQESIKHSKDGIDSTKHIQCIVRCRYYSSID